MPIEELTADEALNLGIDPDSALVMAETANREAGLPAVDRENRPIISYKQYLDLSEANVDISRYAVRMTHPRKGGTYPVQASKLNAWVWRGYIPLGMKKSSTDTKKAVATRRAAANAPEVEVFFCNVKYPDCKRFFDTKRGLTRHWKLDHEKLGKNRTDTEVEPEDEAPEEE